MAAAPPPAAPAPVPPKTQPHKPPRRVRSAYAFFVQENFRNVARQMNTRAPQPIIRALSVLWRHIPEEDKARFKERERKDKERYRNAKAKFSQLHGGYPPKIKRKRRDRDAPRRTRNAFIFFERDAWPPLRIEHPEWNQHELVRELGVRWHNLDVQQRNYYIQMSINDKERYTRELREYRYNKAKRLLEDHMRSGEKKPNVQGQQGQGQPGALQADDEDDFDAICTSSI